MKKICGFLTVIALLALYGCGNTSNVGVHLSDSKRYTSAELNDVVETVKTYFTWNYDNCSLYLIEYNDTYNEDVRDDNMWRYRRSFEPKELTDVLELLISYYDNYDVDKTNTLITETFFIVSLDNGKWEVGNHGRT